MLLQERVNICKVPDVPGKTIQLIDYQDIAEATLYKRQHEQHDLYDGYQIIVPLPEPTKEISVIEHQCSYGSIMNLLEIWADGSIQGYLPAKQTLRIIERVKARESPR